MSDKTGIEWTEATWNPVTGCTKESQGCKHCYAEREWARLSANPKATAYFGRAFNDVKCHPERLDQPLRWKRPRRIFVNSMSDLFHESVPFEFIAAVFGAMSHARQHTFQVLTKRPERMQSFFSWLNSQTHHKTEWVSQVNHAEFICSEPIGSRGSESTPVESLTVSAYYDQSMIMLGGRPHGSHACHWPLPNAWIGVSVEDQSTADERIPLLLQTPAAVRWISAEPLLGPVDLSGEYLAARCGGSYPFKGLEAQHRTKLIDLLDWVVVGGESGPKARPMHPDWARSLRDQCAAAGVPFLFKQWGEWATGANGDYSQHRWEDGSVSHRCGKKASGRLLDGIQHDGYPS